METNEPCSLNVDLHVKYFNRCTSLMPQDYTSLDTSRLMLAYFALSGLDLLGAVDKVVSPENKKHWIEWIYAQQIHPDERPELKDQSLGRCGFRGSPFMGAPHDPHACSTPFTAYDASHVTMSYTALLTLIILGDDLSRVDRAAVAAGIKALQLPSGSFVDSLGNEEHDLRFVFSACAVSFLIRDWSGIDQDRIVEHILASQAFDGGFGRGPANEAHGGITYCALASLALMGRLDALDASSKKRCLEWCLFRQSSGFQGRPAKIPDTCYSFWVGASLHILGYYHLVDTKRDQEFLKTTETVWGGFGKYPGLPPDIMHSYLGLAAMALNGAHGVHGLHSSLNISAPTFERIKSQVVWWRDE
ncbi:geranylgeranyl transferase type-1 subunit beta-like protein [Polychytrium aggregatum]|uniref:geranylgeranyl transferase type-1 subunit beta-like protein n=1 Tax=Polychytrium aggregatum TaxID=110093 RepID=UPI0022FEA258|nr:geranylgeranyl transferase type-1 subunit beta-like protein [Polychytrium aggregatum]KAI9202945.1 geranylgeranyl transferase type-1 subunit beta-like protein [Polychytrium aggregatum]